MTAHQVESLLYKQSGLLGVSELSSDMRALSASDRPEAQEAIELFCWRAAREMGALAATLGGVDGVVFTAGIGENHADVRARICRRLEWLGARLCETANARGEPVISLPDSKIKLWVIPTDEERMIALHTASLLQDGAR